LEGIGGEMEREMAALRGALDNEDGDGGEEDVEQLEAIMARLMMVKGTSSCSPPRSTAAAAANWWCRNGRVALERGAAEARRKDGGRSYEIITQRSILQIAEVITSRPFP
jgi:hypothetical protein